ncbi:hypothetical protein HDV02_001333 [Globomyces sp. JEL0801]|nr:hypothetical protein HDV02_001333 [Globomyces sp. JEL0801]
MPSLFTPFRAVGYVTHDTKLLIQARGSQYFITSKIHNTFHIYNAEKLNLLFVADPLPNNLAIDAIAVQNDATFVASNHRIFIYNKHKITLSLENPTPCLISSLTVMGDLLLALSDSVHIWNLSSNSYHASLPLDPAFSPAILLHPSTYVNKVLIASSDGHLQLWNIRNMKLLFSFPKFSHPITSLVQSPSIDVIAIGLLDGSIILFNIKLNKQLFKFNQDDGQPIMATANMTGNIALWDLEERRLVHIMYDAHDASVHTCFFFHGMPLLLTASSDNSIKQWIFDSLDGTPRLLKSRTGHHQPPNLIQYYGSEGHHVLSTGQDRALRSFCLIRDSQNVELSQGSLVKKSKILNVHVDDLRLPNILQFSSQLAKQAEWDNIISCHSGENSARTWSFQRKAIGKHILPSKDNSAIKFWEFNKGILLDSITLSAPISFFKLHQESRLLAVITDDLTIQVIDIDTKRIVREFQGHHNRITSLAFSPDGRWIITSSMDLTIRTWDLPTGFLIDCFKVPDVCTSLDMSPTGDFLATTHVNQVGIFLWANRSQYTNVPLTPLNDDDVDQVLLPTTSGYDPLQESDTEDDEELVPDEDENQDWIPLDETLISLSSLPKSRWHNLLNLESIKERNKPKEAPKVPEKAPFFLSTTSGPIPKFIPDTTDETETSKVLNLTHLNNDSHLVDLLRKNTVTNDYTQFYSELKSLGPSAIDFEIRNFPLENNYEIMHSFIKSIQWGLQSQTDFELYQTYLNVFLKIHGDVLVEAQIDMEGVEDLVKGSWGRLERGLMYGLCLTEFSMNQ